MNQPVYYSTMDTPIGPLLLAATANGICAIMFGADQKSLFQLKRWTKQWLSHERVVQDDSFLAKAKEQLHDYFQGGKDSFDLPLDLYGTPFQKRVWAALTEIPYGETRSYKQIALAIGMPTAVRAIGGANNRNPIPIVIPCHRVVGSNGALVGYGGGLNIKEQLLQLENAKPYAI